MSHPLAVAFIHGIGRTAPGYSARMRRALTRRFARLIGAEGAERALVFEEINWTAALEKREDLLWRRLEPEAPMRYTGLRQFMIDFAGDAIAYQPAPSDRTAYDAVHREVAARLTRLAMRAGPRAPLCVVAHSLGTVIASNYFYDLLKRENSFMNASVRATLNGTPLERGDTLSLLVTMGSPIALWSLRFPRYGEPLRFPKTALLRHHPSLEPVWINLYDPDDVIGYPLRPLNAAYHAAVTEDRPVDVGSIFTRWNPLSHMGYWDDGRVAAGIAEALAEVWLRSSGLELVSERVRSSRRSEGLESSG
jgi:hypothetical protein